MKASLESALVPKSWLTCAVRVYKICKCIIHALCLQQIRSLIKLCKPGVPNWSWKSCITLFHSRHFNLSNTGVTDDIAALLEKSHRYCHYLHLCVKSSAVKRVCESN